MQNVDGITALLKIKVVASVRSGRLEQRCLDVGRILLEISAVTRVASESSPKIVFVVVSLT